MKAAAISWLFAGLRSDELVRLRVGCIRWQRADGGPAAANAHVSGDDATCLLDVPTHKTGASYTKPVDPLVGEAIALWEAKRPPQPLLVDAKTAESLAVLFCFHGRRVPPRYLNKTLIPALCKGRRSARRCAGTHYQPPGAYHHRYSAVQREGADDAL